MVLSRLNSSEHIEDVGDLLLLVSIPFLAILTLLALFGFTTLAAAVSVLFVLGVIPLLLLFGDSLLEQTRDESKSTDAVADLREQYVEGDLSEAELERAIDREFAVDEADRDSELAADRQRLTEHEDG